MITKEIRSELTDFDNTMNRLLRDRGSLREIQSNFEELAEIIKGLRIYGDADEETNKRLLREVKDIMYEYTCRLAD